LTFVLSVDDFSLAGASIDGGAKESCRQEVCISKSPSSQEPLANPKSGTPRDASVLDIALMSGSMRTINRDVVCGLLAKFLQDVSSTIFVMPYLFVCYWVFNFSLFLY
jgi:hypothetical protein